MTPWPQACTARRTSWRAWTLSATPHLFKYIYTTTHSYSLVCLFLPCAVGKGDLRKPPTLLYACCLCNHYIRYIRHHELCNVIRCDVLCWRWLCVPITQLKPTRLGKDRHITKSSKATTHKNHKLVEIKKSAKGNSSITAGDMTVLVHGCCQSCHGDCLWNLLVCWISIYDI